MNRIVVTKLEHHQTEYLAYLVLDENRKLQELQVFEPEENTLLDHIYVGYVEKIVPNIHAAFVRIADGQKCYLPLNDVKNPVYTRKLSKKEALCEGDELLVQVVKDAVKTKDPVVSTKLVVHGHYCFLSTENTCLGVSKKLSQEESKRLSALLENTCKDHEAEGYGLVFRTNAGAVLETELFEDIELVQKEYRALKKTGTHQNAGDLVYRNLPGYLARLKAENFEKTDLVLTDGQDLYQEICAYLPHLVEEKKVPKPDRIEELIKNHLGTITKAEIVDAAPGISMTTVQRTLTDLVKAEKIIKIGNGRYTKYKWNWDK